MAEHKRTEVHTSAQQDAAVAACCVGLVLIGWVGGMLSGMRQVTDAINVTHRR